MKMLLSQKGSIQIYKYSSIFGIKYTLEDIRDINRFNPFYEKYIPRKLKPIKNIEKKEIKILNKEDKTIETLKNLGLIR